MLQVGKGRPKKYCSPSCARRAEKARRKKPKVKACERCGGPIAADSLRGGPRRKYCSKECRYATAKKYVKPCISCETGHVRDGGLVCKRCRNSLEQHLERALSVLESR